MTFIIYPHNQNAQKVTFFSLNKAPCITASKYAAHVFGLTEQIWGKSLGYSGTRRFILCAPAAPMLYKSTECTLYFYSVFLYNLHSIIF